MRFLILSILATQFVGCTLPASDELLDCPVGAVLDADQPCMCGSDKVEATLDTAGGWCCDPAIGATWDADLDCSS